MCLLMACSSLPCWWVWQVGCVTLYGIKSYAICGVSRYLVGLGMLRSRNVQVPGSIPGFGWKYGVGHFSFWSQEFPFRQ
jgi:hypothetical protein